jgi:hypothetical protein
MIGDELLDRCPQLLEAPAQLRGIGASQKRWLQGAETRFGGVIDGTNVLWLEPQKVFGNRKKTRPSGAGLRTALEILQIAQRLRKIFIGLGASEVQRVLLPLLRLLDPQLQMPRRTRIMLHRVYVTFRETKAGIPFDQMYLVAARIFGLARDLFCRNGLVVPCRRLLLERLQLSQRFGATMEEKGEP